MTGKTLTTRTACIFCIILGSFTWHGRSQQAISRMYTFEEVKWMFHEVEKLDPTKKHLLENLQQLRPNQHEYSVKDVMTVLGPSQRLRLAMIFHLHRFHRESGPFQNKTPFEY